jgi:NAD(P)-dependent dehydrogenase (short-subunit alcohol dehydrogenase family)
VNLAGKVCVVTGASAGIGEATARSLANSGAKLVLAARREERLREIADELGEGASAVRCDVTKVEDLESLREEVVRRHGRCDVLINNAGIPGGGRFADLSMEQLQLVTATNYLSVLYGTKAFLPLLLESRGHVVNVASLAGRYALPGAAVYTASKYGVVGLSESLSYSSDFRVTAICPGFAETERFRARDMPRFLTVTKEAVADKIVEVIRTGRVGTVHIPAWAGPLAAFQSLTPRLYRAAVELGTRPYRERATPAPPARLERA